MTDPLPVTVIPSTPALDIAVVAIAPLLAGLLSPASGLRRSTGLVTTSPLVETASVFTSRPGASIFAVPTLLPRDGETFVTPSLLTSNSEGTVVTP